MKNTNEFPENDNVYGKSNRSASKTLVALAAGAAAGAVTAMLLTPKNGSETRRAIADGANRIKDGLSDTLKQGMDKFNGMVAESNLNGSATRLKNDITDTARQTSENLRGAEQAISNGANRAKNDVTDSIKQGIDKLSNRVSEARGNNTPS